MTVGQLRVPGVPRGEGIEVWLDGVPVDAYAGETIATVLWAAGRRSFRRTPGGAPRGLYCGMGLCHECLVTVDGVPNVRACMTPVRPGMRIDTGAANQVASERGAPPARKAS